MNASCALSGCIWIIIAVLTASGVGAVDLDVEATASGGSTGNLFSDSTAKEDTYSTVAVDLKWYALSFARVNLVSEYSHYGSFVSLSNLVGGGGLTLIPFPDSSRLSAYVEGNFKRREYRKAEATSTSLNANEFTGDEYDGKVGLGYDLSSMTQIRTGLAYKTSQYGIDGVIDREKLDLTAGVNTTLLGSLGFDLEVGYSTGEFQKINPKKSAKDVDTLVDRLAIFPGEQYSILLIGTLKSFYVSPRLSRSLGRKTGLSLTYSRRQFVDHDDKSVIYGYSTGYLSPWLGEFAGQAAVFKIKTFLIPRLITSLSVGFWEREHLRTVENEIKPSSRPPFTPAPTVNLLYAQERTDWRRRIDFKVQWPLRLGGGVTMEPSLEFDYTDNNSTVRVYHYDNLAFSGGLTVRF